MKILPGMISAPGWPGQRCLTCARPIGGDGSDPGMAFCHDTGKTCLTLEMIPWELRDKFAKPRIWQNAGQAFSDLYEAIEWMATPRDWLSNGSVTPSLTPIQMVRAGRGLEVLEAQFSLFEHLVRLNEQVERATATARSAVA